MRKGIRVYRKVYQFDLVGENYMKRIGEKIEKGIKLYYNGVYMIC